MSHKTNAEPLKLMPLDDLKKVVAGIVKVPKSEIDAAEAKRPKRKRRVQRDA